MYLIGMGVFFFTGLKFIYFLIGNFKGAFLKFVQCVDLGSGDYLAVLGALLIIAEYYWLVGMHFCSPTLHMGIQCPCEVIMNNSWISLNFSWILFMKCSWNIHEDPMNLLLDIFKSINQAKQLLSVLLWWSMVPLSKLWMPYSIWLKTWIKFNNWKVIAECSGELYGPWASCLGLVYMW